MDKYLGPGPCAEATPERASLAARLVARGPSAAQWLPLSAHLRPEQTTRLCSPRFPPPPPRPASPRLCPLQLTLALLGCATGSRTPDSLSTPRAEPRIRVSASSSCDLPSARHISWAPRASRLDPLPPRSTASDMATWRHRPDASAAGAARNGETVVVDHHRESASILPQIWAARSPSSSM